MIDYSHLTRILSVPRPNGSRALKHTSQALQGWLKERSIPYKIHRYPVYPYFFEAIGAWIIFSRTLLAGAIHFRWGWLSLPIALASLIGGLVDIILGIPVVSWPKRQTGENILVRFDTADTPPEQEVVLCAHYDSKTELLDHQQRMFLLKSLPAGILLTAALGVLGSTESALKRKKSPGARHVYDLGRLLSVPLLLLAWGLGINLTAGRVRKPSQGTIDNGAACSILLGLAAQIKLGKISLKRTRVTLALFSGEEINMQGSRAYVRSRSFSLPTAALNLEAMAQNGPYVVWETDGFSLRLDPVPEWLNERVTAAVEGVTGVPPLRSGPMNSDGGSFLLSGIPATTMGTYDRDWVDRGFHTYRDNPQRLAAHRLPEAVQILTRFLEITDEAGIPEP